jgi:hypothetical protein
MFSLISQFFYTRKKLSLLLLFFAFSYLIYGHYLFSGSFTASGDFAPAISYVLNFQKAFADGQWIPRWMIVAREFTFGGGSIDGTIPTLDSPAFQYYGFLQSALAFPLLLLKIPPIPALQIVIILAFSCSGMILYKVGRMLGANRYAAFLSGYSYIISPWLISNFYERGGISEGLGQATLPLIILGYAFAIKKQYRLSVITITASTAILALSHNIFLLYGVLVCSFFIFFSLIREPLEDISGNRKYFKRINLAAPIILGMGILLGLAITSWQWLPAMMTLNEISFHYIGSFNQKIPASLADLSGALGKPKQFYAEWAHAKLDFFFTIGWWTIPSILSLIFAPKNLRKVAASIFVTFVVFFALTYLPRPIFPHLPSFFGATQFTFRLLSFLSVLGSFALCLSIQHISRKWAIIFFILITLSQLNVLLYKMPEQKLTDEQCLKAYEYNAFYAESPYGQNIRFWYDGWLDESNILQLKGLKAPIFLTITGKAREDLKQIQLFVAPISDPKHPVSNVVNLTSGKDFKIVLKINKSEDNLRIYTIPSYNAGWRRLSIRPEKINLISGIQESFVPASEVNLLYSHGYQRVFEVNKDKIKLHKPNKEGFYSIELPTIYNRFSIPVQNNQKLLAQVDFNHRLNVLTHDLNAPITINYEWPKISIILTFIGTLGMLILMLIRPRNSK